MTTSAPYLRRAANGFYYIHWTQDRIGKRVSTRRKVLDGPDGAQAALEIWPLRLEQVERAIVATDPISEVWARYCDEHVRPERQERGAAYTWKNLEPYFGRLPVGSLSQKLINGYVAKRAAGKIGRPSKPVSCRRELVTLKAAFAHCSLPWPKMKLPAASPPRDRWLKTEEIQRLMEAAADLRRGPHLSRAERFLWIALETAAREEAILQLTWDRVDFEAGIIDFNVPDRKVTKKRRAVVPISSTLLPILKRAYAERLHKRRPDALVMGSPSTVWGPIQIIAARAGLAGERHWQKHGTKPKRTGVSPHVLRHTAATHMARRGVPLWIIAKILANSLLMVERVYAKWQPKDLQVGIDQISAGLLKTPD